jgi:hypothetical protein
VQFVSWPNLCSILTGCVHCLRLRVFEIGHPIIHETSLNKKAHYHLVICRKLDTGIIQKHQNEASFHILCMKYLQLNIFRACKLVRQRTIAYLYSMCRFRHGRTGRKKLGGRKEISQTFSDCAHVVKKNFPDKLSKIVVDGGGGGREEWLRKIPIRWHISHKIARICPIYFYNKPILPDREANIVRLALFAQRTMELPPPLPAAYRPWISACTCQK